MTTCFFHDQVTTFQKQIFKLTVSLKTPSYHTVRKYIGAVTTRNFAYYGEGTGPIHLSAIDCRGQEFNLGNCPHTTGNNDGCTHAEDAGVLCLDASGNYFSRSYLNILSFDYKY